MHAESPHSALQLCFGKTLQMPFVHFTLYESKGSVPCCVISAGSVPDLSLLSGAVGKPREVL